MVIKSLKNYLWEIDKLGFSACIDGKRREVLYQDAWVKGRAVEKGGRECEFRYEAIRKVIKKLNRPIKVLDIGANMGYFSFRLAEEFDGLFVMVEGAETVSKALLKLCKLNRNKKSILLKRSLTLECLKYLAKHETFDVVLALSIIHHFEEPYNEVFEVLRTIGSYLIFEPPIYEENTLNQERIRLEPIDFKKYSHKAIVKIPCASKYRNHLYRTTYVLPCKDFKKNEDMALNYQTFLNFNGIFPVKEELMLLNQSQDFNPENFILTGTDLLLKN